MDSEIEGDLLEVTAEGVVGWVVSGKSPANLPLIVLCINGTPFARTVADRFDLHSVRSRVGEGIPSFLIKLPEIMGGKPPFRLELRLPTGRRLGRPLIIAEALNPTTSHSGDPSVIVGSVEALDRGTIVGWACDTKSPDRVLSIEVIDGEILLATGVADQPRSGVPAIAEGNVNAGFRIELPARLLDGRDHLLRVRVAGASTELSNSPLAFGPKEVTPVLTDIILIKQSIALLNAQVSELARPGGKLQQEVLRLLAERTAAFAAIEQNMLDCRLGMLEAQISDAILRLPRDKRPQ